MSAADPPVHKRVPRSPAKVPSTPARTSRTHLGSPNVPAVNPKTPRSPYNFRSKRKLKFPTPRQIDTETPKAVVSPPKSPPKPRRSGRTTHKSGKYVFSADVHHGGEGPKINLSDVSTATLQACINTIACNINLDKEAAAIIEPSNHDEAASDPDYGVEWIKAEKREVQSLLENKTFREVKIKDLPSGTRIVSGRWVYKVKSDAEGKITIFKARVVAHGFKTVKGIHYDDTFAPVVNTNTIKLLLAIAVTLGLHLRSIDFKTAFLHTVREDEYKKVYLKPPKGAGCPDDKVWEILRALYGLPDSPLL